jgi:hypothetical protein
VKKDRSLIFLLAFLLVALACNLPVPTATTPAPGVTVQPGITLQPGQTIIPPTVQVETQAPAATVAPLTADILRNGTYLLPESKETVTLADGKYDRAASNEDILHAAIVEPIAFGDLDGDGVEDAAVLISENMGGTGFFVSLLVMLNQGGAPVQSAAYFLEDRPQINNLTITGGRIAVDAVIHGPADPMCCPNFPAVETFRYRNGSLFLVRFSSRTPGDAERAITLTGPADGAAVSGSVQASGTVTISPFENTLAYRILNASGVEIAAGSFLVTSDGMGGAGTFNVPISLAGIPAGMIRLTVSDLSAADGSLLAMDSVELKVE